jgi:hypothetical protein
MKSLQTFLWLHSSAFLLPIDQSFLKWKIVNVSIPQSLEITKLSNIHTVNVTTLTVFSLQRIKIAALSWNIFLINVISIFFVYQVYFGIIYTLYDLSFFPLLLPNQDINICSWFFYIFAMQYYVLCNFNFYIYPSFN